MKEIGRGVMAAAAAAVCVVGLGGCDYWPPALQQQIAAQAAQLKTLGTEKTALQGKIAELSKATDDCKAQAAQVAKGQADLQAQVDQLKTALAEAEAKIPKAKGKAPGKK